MKIAINGAGIAGPALAWWLQHYGHEPVLFERAPELRTGGYIIDFWGIGYDVAEKMGLLPELREAGYRFESVRMVNRNGRQIASLDVGSFQSLLGNRFFSIARGDIASIIFRACRGLETHFGKTVAGIRQHAAGVIVEVSDGSEREFDLVVGADGLHSQVRAKAFGPEAQFEHHLDCHVAAFPLANYRPRDESVYVTHTVPKRQVGRAALRNDVSMFLFIFRSDLLGPLSESRTHPKQILREVFGDMKWEIPQILARLDEVEEVYFDRVSQIRMDRWTTGRVALVGDAAACVSFLAGEGTGLAIAEAYVLAGELHRAGGDYQTAFEQYEAKLRTFLAQKQKAATRIIGFFAPKTARGLFLRNLLMKVTSIPFLGNRLLGSAIRDDIQLPSYEPLPSTATKSA
ncbi:MAG TPA: FAD-binding domain [Fimbriiglobus sp.]|jgi:2-polyprenyl-6-methoxyphenol hydroxylase-like FAD-dependent oxidoreductase